MHSQSQGNYSKALIDIIIPVYGEFDFLSTCLDRIPEAVGTIPYRIYVVDNGSPDREKAIEFFQNYKNVKIFAVKTIRENVGYPRACNIGASMGSSPYILIHTPDVWYQKDGIKNLYDTIIKDEKIGIVCPKLIFPDDSPWGKGGTVQHAGVEMAIDGSVHHLFIGWNPNHPKVNVPSDVYAATGASFLTRRKLWKFLDGYFDGYGKGTYEDIDYAVRVHATGLKVMYEPSAVATHYVNATKEQYPLNLNSQIFKLRCQPYFTWTDWRRL